MLSSCKKRFPKHARLLSSHQFRRVAKYGHTVSGSVLTIQLCASKYARCKLGLTVSRKQGKAVYRNRFKRLVREAFRLSQEELPLHLHLNVRPTRPLADSLTLTEIQAELVQLCVAYAAQRTASLSTCS